MDNGYVDIDLDLYRENFRAAVSRAGTACLAVVKADAYGVGAIPVAKALEADCAFFGVANMTEARELREAGLKKPILILSPVHREDFPEAIRQDVRVPIFTWEAGKALSDAAVRLGKTAKLHFAVDTGMSRIGFPATEESADICRRIACLPGIEAEGLFSHFATADEADLTHADRQRALFESFREMLRQRGVEIPICHLNNSAGLMNYGKIFDMARVGIVMHGLYPSGEVPKERLPVKPALQWFSRVSMVKWLEPGQAVSYGRCFIADRPMKVATVATGYADGYNRHLSNGFSVLIRGKRAGILGRICMDQFVVDVTEIPDTAEDDKVTLIGTDGDETITAEEMAEACGTISYEVYCNIHRRVVRNYYENGKLTQTVRYAPYK